MSGSSEAPASRRVALSVRQDVDAPLDEERLRSTLARKLRLDPNRIEALELVGRSLDARRRDDVFWTCRFCVTLENPEDAKRAVDRHRAQPWTFKPGKGRDTEILSGDFPVGRSTDPRPVIIGSGPGGLFAAWLLARHGRPPIVLERGERIEKRVRDVLSFERGGEFNPESNTLFGEGGAGTFSDGKLTSRSKSPLVRTVNEIVVSCTGPKDVLIDAKPHVGTDRLRAVLVHLRRRLEDQGVAFEFGARVDNLLIDRDRVRGVQLAGGRRIETDSVILAIGHSARDTYAMLRERGVKMEFKPFQTGLRIEHRQERIDRAQFGDFADRLPAAEYVLIGPGERNTFSFCMCPGGIIMPSVSEPGHLCSNGMSRSRRDSGWANSGLVYTVQAEDLGSSEPDPFAGIALQRSLESRAFALTGETYRLPAQRASDFLQGRVSSVAMETSYPLGVVAADLDEVLIPGARASMIDALQAFERRIPGFAGDQGILVGPESRGSSPIRIPRDPHTLEASGIRGLYPVGEGAGFAGGIVSAAIDGMRSAHGLLRAGV